MSVTARILSSGATERKGRPVTEHQEVTIQPSVVGWILILLHLGLGFVTIALAVDERFARGKVEFANEGWRFGLGAVGLFLAFRAARGLVRTITRATVELSPATRRSSRLNGIAFQLIGAGFWLAAANGEIAARSVAFESWAQSVYLVSGIFLVFTGTIYWINPARRRREQATPQGPFVG